MPGGGDFQAGVGPGCFKHLSDVTGRLAFSWRGLDFDHGAGGGMRRTQATKGCATR